MKLGHQHRGHNYVLNVKALVDAFNQEKALVGAFSVIVQPVVEPMDRFTALLGHIWRYDGMMGQLVWGGNY